MILEVSIEGSEMLQVGLDTMFLVRFYVSVVRKILIQHFSRSRD